MAERFPSGPSRSRPGREAADRILDGEDRSGTIQDEGKGGNCDRCGCTKERFGNPPDPDELSRV